MSDANLGDADRGDSLTSLFLSDLPSMAAIVTVVSQPFAQESLRQATGLPEWMPVAVALMVSGLLAIYKILIVRRSRARDCAICVPIMMLVVFATYATGNNVVYYAKEGFTRPMSTEQVSALQRERDILEEQLRNAEQTLSTLRRALDLPAAPEAKPRSALPAPSGWARLLGPDVAEAQTRGGTRPPQPVDRERAADRSRPAERAPSVDRQRLMEQLRKYDLEQRELEARRQSVRPDTGTRESPPSPPLIKSW
jgi:hypothetical protein